MHPPGHRPVLTHTHFRSNYVLTSFVYTHKFANKCSYLARSPNHGRSPSRPRPLPRRYRTADAWLRTTIGGAGAPPSGQAKPADAC
eukprot:9488081-Pyramimonas_sp.AAC.1